MKYLTDLKDIIISTDTKSKKLPNIPNWKLDDQDFTKFELDPKNKFNNKKINWKADLAKHYALNFLLEGKGKVKSNIDHFDFSKIIQKYWMSFVTKSYNKYFKYKIRNQISESDINNLSNDQKHVVQRNNYVITK